MQDILSMIPSSLDGAIVPLATALATALIFILKKLFSLVRKLAKKTPLTFDDQLIDATEEQLKTRAKDL